MFVEKSNRSTDNILNVKIYVYAILLTLLFESVLLLSSFGDF